MDENLGAYYAQQPPPPPPGPGSNYPSSSSYYHPQPPPPGAPAPPPQTIHIPYIPQQPPTASYAAYVPSYVAPVAAIHDQVRTLFIAGLPEDVKPREIYNLFREFLGYESSHLRSSSQTTQPFAFATFVDQPSAIAAMQALNKKIKLKVARYYKEGMVFDLEKGSTLYIDLAKSNSRSKRLRTDDEWSSLDKKAKGSSTSTRGPVDSGSGSVHLPGMANSACNTIGYPSAQSYRSYDGRAATESSAGKTSNSLSPPCPTLFVANLGPNCTEQELIQVFSGCRGFLKLKMQSTYGAPVAFVDFKDTACSTEALNHLQGTILYSSPAGEGMRLEYAKSRMGMRRKAK